VKKRTKKVLRRLRKKLIKPSRSARKKTSGKAAKLIKKIALKIQKIRSGRPRKRNKVSRPSPYSYNNLNAATPAFASSSAPVQAFEFPSAYGENKIVLLVRDPWWIFAYWEITPARETEIMSAIQREGLSRERTALRIYDVTGRADSEAHNFFDIEIHGLFGQWHVDVGKPDREWIAEIGIRTRDGRFLALARSNRVRTPRYGLSDILDEEWMMPDELYWKLLAMGSLDLQRSSLDLSAKIVRDFHLPSSENSSRFSQVLPAVKPG